MDNTWIRSWKDYKSKKMNYKIIINQENPYDKQDFANRKLVSYQNDNQEIFYLEKKTYQAFLKLQQLTNIKLDITSALRSIEQQELIYQATIQEQGLEYAKNYVAPPGESEHHSGLCFDITFFKDGAYVKDEDLLKEENIVILEQEVIPKLEEAGLILRYPKRKEGITGYCYEPWHYRYVGKSTATIMKQNHLCLEQYHKKYQKSGVLLIDKPKGMTSFDVVSAVGKIMDTKKIGHNGTLDPLATGLLVLTINQATKINEYLTATNKEYIAEILIGQKTDTQDITGNIIEQSNKTCTKEQIMKVLQNFPKSYLQEVPIYSAVKVKGKKLYEYARKGQEVTLPKRLVTIENLTLLSYNDNTFTIQTTVSKGCYIRALIQDIAKELGVLLTMKNLRRTKQGAFTIENAYTLQQLSVDTPFLPIDKALNIKTVKLRKQDQKPVKNGASIPNDLKIKEDILFMKGEKPIAIYQPQGARLTLKKML